MELGSGAPSWLQQGSQVACRKYQLGRISPVALKVLSAIPQLPDIHIREVKIRNPRQTSPEGFGDSVLGENVVGRLWLPAVYNGSAENPYTNPGAPVHIITGSAGCQEKLDPFVKNPSNWSAVRYSDYGYTLMTLHNKTHLTLQQFSMENGRKLLDEITIVKDRHGPYDRATR
ncbi:acid phosphatase type 7-like [Haemaphysalis longicornis]